MNDAKEVTHEGIDICDTHPVVNTGTDGSLSAKIIGEDNTSFATVEFATTSIDLVSTCFLYPGSGLPLDTQAEAWSCLRATTVLSRAMGF